VSTLVLSSSFLPLKVVSWKKAFILVFSGRADWVHFCPEKVIRSVSAEFPFPTVIRYKYGGQKFFNRNKMTRDALYKRDNGCCGYCGDRISKTKMTKDHVIPRCQNGQDAWNNVVLACQECNAEKGGRTPQQAGMVLSTKPQMPVTAYLGGKHHEHWQPYLFT
tara:strand:- start:73 stop:561 length:489 start_codon:yes stop_codon:yes gene_type:complete